VKLWLYLLDYFVPIEESALNFDDPHELFESVRSIVEAWVGRVEGIKVSAIWSDPETSESVVEYLVELRSGDISVKVLRSDDPTRTLARYYGL